MSLNTWRALAVAASILSVVSCGQSASTGSGGTTNSPSGGGNTNNTPASNDTSSGSSSSGGSSASAGSGSSTSVGSSGSTSVGSSGSASSASSGSTSNASTADGGSAGSMVVSSTDPNTVTLTMGTFTVPPNDEVFMCQDFDNPFGGVDAAIGTSEADMTAGSHHLHVFYGEDSPPSRTVAACANPYEFRSLLFAAGQPMLVSQYPAGMAAKLQGTLGLRLQSHYVNTSASTITANVVVKFTKVDPSTVTKWVAQLYFNRVVLSVPPGNGQTVSTTCTVPSTYGQIGLIDGASHMHSRGVNFVATTSTGVQLIQTTQWDEPPIVTYPNPIMLNPGDSINWTCTYNNTTGSTLTFGDSALKNEMCIFLARFYSAPSGNDIECQSPSDMDEGTVTDNVPQ
jgi:hypothetical protein